MSQPVTKPDPVMPGPVASAEQIRRWQALPRDEQLRRLCDTLVRAHHSGASPRSMAAIKAAAQQRLAAAKNE